MVAITNTTSLTFLKEAIDTTLTEAENQLEAFSVSARWLSCLRQP